MVGLAAIGWWTIGPWDASARGRAEEGLVGREVGGVCDGYFLVVLTAVRAVLEDEDPIGRSMAKVDWKLEARGNFWETGDGASLIVIGV